MITRERAIETLRSERFDLVVIGGGITGAGVALDAASRGYSVALVEKADFASGTSSRSSKLVHGGLRYLQNFDLGLVREALLERQLMVRLAPHLVTPLQMVVAAFDGARPDRLIGIGLNMYDVMATPALRGRRGANRSDSDWSPARHRMISGEEVVELLPALAAREPTSGYLFYDCQTDDSRLVLTVLGEAERFGAICANRLEVSELFGNGSGGALHDGTGSGVKVRDAETGEEFASRRQRDQRDRRVGRPDPPGGAPLGGRGPEDRPQPRNARDRRARGPAARGGAIVPAGEGRSIFALPWLGRSLLGTTDNNYSGDIDHVQPVGEDIEYLLEATNRVLRDLARLPSDLDRRLRGRAAADLLRRHRASRSTSRARPSSTRPRAG